MTDTASTLIALAQIDFHTKTAKFVDLGKEANLKAYTWLPSDDGHVHIDWSKGLHLVPIAFEDKSSDSLEAWRWKSNMEDSPYTAGLYWAFIPYSQEAMAEFAARNGATVEAAA